MPHRATTVNFKANARKAMADVNLQKALEKMRSGFVEKRLAATGRLPEFNDLRDEARRRMEPVLDRLADFIPPGKKNGKKRARNDRRIALVLWALCIGVAHLAKGGALEDIGMKPDDILKTGTDCILRTVANGK